MEETSEPTDGFVAATKTTPEGEARVSDRLAEVEPVVRRVIAARVVPEAVDDLVQGTLLRLARSARQLNDEELTAYAASAARNATVSHYRTLAQERRAQHQVLDLTAPPGPEAIAVAQDEAVSLQTVLQALDPEDRALIESHHIEEVGVAELARRSGRTEMATRLRLARARARVRVHYALAREGRQLPTTLCEPVLYAIASGDRRSQQRLNTQEHLASCEACARLAGAVSGQRRPVIGFVAAMWGAWKARPRGVQLLAVGSVTALAAAATFAVVQQRPDTAGPPRPAATTAVAPALPPGRLRTIDGPLGATPQALAAASSRTVSARGAEVVSVPADEGFWIRSDDGGTIWVALAGTASESTQHVTTGAHATFTGKVRQVTATLPVSARPPAGAAALRLLRQGYYLDVPVMTLRLR